MSKQLLRYGIFVLLIIGLWGAGELVLREIQTGDACPKILYIPMCIVILVCFIIPLVAHLFKKWNALFYVFAGVAGSSAVVASVLDFMGMAECPQTPSGTPMCYYSLLLFGSLLVAKIGETRLPNTQNNNEYYGHRKKKHLSPRK